MNWLLKLKITASPLGATKFPVDFFQSEGGVNSGFVSDQKLQNNMVLLDEFEDAKKDTNLIVGMNKQNYSMKFVNLTRLTDGFDSATFEAECHSINSNLIKYISLVMVDVRISSLGLTTIGQNMVYRYKLSFNQANYYLK